MFMLCFLTRQANEAQGWRGWAEEQSSLGDAETWYRDRHLMYHDDGDAADDDAYDSAPRGAAALSASSEGPLSATRLGTYLVYGLVNTVRH